MVNCGTKLYPQMADSYLSTFSHTSQDISQLTSFQSNFMYKTIKYNFSFGRVDGNQIFKSAYYLRTFYSVPTSV